VLKEFKVPLDLKEFKVPLDLKDLKEFKVL